jgi:hypothetical protein
MASGSRSEPPPATTSSPPKSIPPPQDHDAFSELRALWDARHAPRASQRPNRGRRDARRRSKRPGPAGSPSRPSGSTARRRRRRATARPCALQATTDSKGSGLVDLCPGCPGVWERPVMGSALATSICQQRDVSSGVSRRRQCPAGLVPGIVALDDHHGSYWVLDRRDQLSAQREHTGQCERLIYRCPCISAHRDDRSGRHV